MIVINVAKDFSKTPFGRYEVDSPSSAEKFRDKILIPALLDNPNEEIVVDFSNVMVGLGSSFLEEVFGGLIRKKILPNDEVKRRLKIISKLPIYEQQINKFINNAITEAF
ncbi:TPA: STAS-like domain-containing protein [Citrobacter farmeri]|uniref:STAS-like domain-containing protein n=1 Tax=Citrobacter farmeri TaxID=67824 RepID=UPI001A2799E0|nr:STAS-like domain-containing protein [Citrobacter farmeri]MBU5644085.1 STAS-like domain-containing protein [Pluralibacter sp. S54_ASV_43]HAT3756932.1 STAS-like domain-containing protein [Citrobacter amalonaticus]QZE47622.1 STAS-like domain-containing protein [Citrobacter farmeri]HCB1594029.1 STAS-like domain-containing protein [Citrobacter farmeri]HCB1652218.1 STAS-like domain-containing protein [Citrobacter farmeri]